MEKFLGFEFVFGFFLDLIIGDPDFSWHPIRLIGKMINFLEKKLLKFKKQKIAGMVLVAIILSGVYFICWFILKISSEFNVYFGYLIAILFCLMTISAKSLSKEAREVFNALKENNLALARKKLSMIVGRDTEKLNEKEIIRATIETVAENTVDGATAPLFYLILGGPALGMAYKAVNTLDSMVGYKNEKYQQFGWLSAKLDDLANYLPARITGLIFPLASFFCGQRARDAFKAMLRDGRKHPSPNSGISEAAMAGSLGIQLGGLNYYNGKPSFRPYLGSSSREPSAEHIKKAVRLMYAASIIFLVLGIIFKFLIL